MAARQCRLTFVKPLRPANAAKRFAERIRNLDEEQLKGLFAFSQNKLKEVHMSVSVPMMQAAYWKLGNGLFFSLMGLCLRLPELNSMAIITLGPDGPTSASIVGGEGIIT